MTHAFRRLPDPIHSCRRPRLALTLAAALFALPFAAGPVDAAAANGTVEALVKLVETPGVSGREEAVRETVKALLPQWALKAARTDAMGNLIVTTGSGEPSVLYVAHMDEIGYMVTHIRPDGKIQVQKLGGFYDSQYEGQVVHIYTAKGPVNGVVVIPSIHLHRGVAAPKSTFSLEDVFIDVGTESREETERLGVALLDPITVPKKVTPLAGTRMAGRSMDDRFGDAALVSMVRRLQPSDVKGTLTVAWSVQEEVGLRGAEALSKEMTPDLVVAVDSFVTSDSPIENPRVGYAKLGAGPVIRALDNSNIAPIALVRSLMSFAASKHLTLSYGATQGGNDGSMFNNGKSRVLPMAIPIRYSHSAIETIDTTDLTGLVDLLVEMVKDPSWAR